jgi:hypothetical protein
MTVGGGGDSVAALCSTAGRGVTAADPANSFLLAGRSGTGSLVLLTGPHPAIIEEKREITRNITRNGRKTLQGLKL